jgi:ketosteroid isomerase-like protein
MRSEWRTIVMLLIAINGLSLGSMGQSATQEKQEGAIRAVLTSQVEAWNRHDLEGFMAGYWNSPALMFFSGATETAGWQATLERYRKKYQAADSEMGKLAFKDLQVEMLGPSAAFAQGKFLLTLSNGKQSHGLFTLIFREFPDGCRIVHDHTSAE